MTQREANEENLNESKLAILKQRYELLEKTLVNVEKEKEYYRVRASVSAGIHSIVLPRICTSERRKIWNISKRSI